MFCKRCGKYNPDKEPKCKYCGGELTQMQNNQPSYNDEDHTVLGVLMCLFVGLPGLIIGLCIFRNGYARESFVTGWLRCLVWTILIALLICALTLLVVCTTAGVHC